MQRNLNAIYAMPTVSLEPSALPVVCAHGAEEGSPLCAAPATGDDPGLQTVDEHRRCDVDRTCSAKWRVMTSQRAVGAERSWPVGRGYGPREAAIWADLGSANAGLVSVRLVADG